MTISKKVLKEIYGREYLEKHFDEIAKIANKSIFMELDEYHNCYPFIRKDKLKKDIIKAGIL